MKSIISYAVLIIASFLSAFPLYYMLCGATNTSIDVVRGRLYPGTYLVENFKTLVGMQNLELAMFNSFRNAIIITFVALLVCSIAGYECIHCCNTIPTCCFHIIIANPYIFMPVL